MSRPGGMAGSRSALIRGNLFVDSIFRARSSRTLSAAGRGSVALVLSISALALNVAPAFAAGDTTPPAAVKGMTTSADTSRVKLDWSSNSEADLAGYLVYRATSVDGTYTPLTATPRTSSDYSDTAAPVGYPAYYKVTAVDKTGNESDPVAVSGVRKDGTKPLAVKSLTGAQAATGEITLDWADNAEADLAGYLVTRATTSGGTYTKLNTTPTKDSTLVDKTAQVGGSYYYKVTAVDLGGNASSAVSVSVLPPDHTAPKPVATISVSLSTSSVKLDWASNTESDLAGYNVYRAASATGSYTKLTATPRTSSDYTDSTAPVGVTSFYQVMAVDKSGNESTPVAASGVRKDGVAPATVKSLTGSRTTDGSVTLKWGANTEADLAGYMVTRATTSGGTYTKLTASPITEVTFEDKTAPAGGSYFYKVTALDVSGNSSSAASVSVLPPDVTAPNAVAPISTTLSTSSVKLDWASNSEADLAGYNVYRATAVDGSYAKLTATPRTASDYTDTTAPVGVTSYYKVTAVDASGNESSPVAASGVRKDGVAPATVKSLTGTRTTDAGITLDWAPNGETDLVGYMVTRATTSGGTYAKLTTSPITALTFEDTAAPAGGSFYYKVTAVDLSGNSSSAASVSVLPPDTTAPKLVTGMVVSTDTSRVKLDWASNSESDLAGYNVYRAATADGEYVKLTATPRTSSDYSDTAAPVGVTSYYRVTAVDKTGNESAPLAASGLRKDSVAPAAVKMLTVAATDAGVMLDWADNTDADLAGYLVTRSTTSGGTYTKLNPATLTESTYVDSTAVAGTSYFYKVAALDASGNTSATASVSFVPADTTAPAVVAGLAAKGGDKQIALTWTAGADADLAGYNVYRWVDGADAGTAVKLTTSPVSAASYTDKAVPDAAGYRYAVTAVDKVGNESARSTDVLAAVADTTAPAVPGTLTATGTAADVTLDWADDTDADLAGYLVSRSDSATGTFTKLTDTPITASAFKDATAVAGTKAFYQVTAVDQSGNESAAATAEGTRLVEKAPVAGANLTVAQDGSGDYTTVAAALAAAPANATAPYVIGIKPGTYHELLSVTKPNITFTGATANAADVVISYDNAAGTINPASATGAAYGTSGSATVLIKANNVITKNLTIENAYKETGTGNEQAVALKTTGDKLVFDNVRLLGDQDTLYADSAAAGTVARSYYTNSYVEGDVDFVFGRGTAVFDHSTLKAATRGSTSNNGYVTAASTDKSTTYGYLITDSTITSDAPAGTFSLGRPWQPSNDPNAIAQVVVRNTELPAAIKASAWSDMTTTFSWRNARFAEYQNSGTGAVTNADRPQLSDVEAAKYTKFSYLAGTDGWNPTGQTPPPPPADTTAPAVPADLATVPADSKIDLTWTANGEDDLAGYNLYRSTSSTVATTATNKLNASLLTGTSYTDKTAANGTAYSYVLTAVDKAGNESVASTSATATPVGVPLPAHDILVAADGTGQYTTVQAALDAAPAGTAAKPTVIAVKPGTYKEMMTLSKNYVTVIGTTGDAKDVVLTYDNAADTTIPGGTATYGTGGSQSVLVKGNNVTVKDLTISNSFDEAAYAYKNEQAVALKTTGDRLKFDNVRLLGNQDTLLVDSPDAPVVARSYFVNSYIEGDVDFIFGRGTAVFSHSTINALSRGSSSNNGYVTAASTSDKNPNGFLIVDSTITSNAPAGTFSLGRPWRGWTDGYLKNGVTYNSRGQVTIANTVLPAAIRTTQPWADMSPNLWTDGRFSEYGNTGAGAGVNANRPQLTDAQAADATPAKYLAGTDGWNPAS
jgi:pectin methylesterase-like acyl-CoA thioesterase